ncbi:MAG: hypothetical protein AB7V04_02120 [Desulfomonilaceae bacterium]
MVSDNLEFKIVEGIDGLREEDLPELIILPEDGRTNEFSSHPPMPFMMTVLFILVAMLIGE